MSELVARLLIELEDITPRIWRRVDVPAAITLSTLHDVLQAVMRWDYAHLYEFRVGDRAYGDPLPGLESASGRVYKAKGIRLNQLMDRGVDHFTYVYDFGDDWRHRITIESVRGGGPGTDYPIFVEGECRAPPDDVGGVPGFMNFRDAIADPSHPDHAFLLEWAGGSFDPEDIDRREIEIEIEIDLAMLAEFRRRVRAGHRSRARKKAP